MIVLDTNILSEVMSTAPAQAVVDWLNARETVSLYLTTLTIAEIGYGLAILPPGNRRTALEERFEAFIAEAFHSRILDFDQRAARKYGQLMGRRRELGRPMSGMDGQIAAIAASHRFAVAARNIRDFEECGLQLIDPFSSLA